MTTTATATAISRSAEDMVSAYGRALLQKPPISLNAIGAAREALCVYIAGLEAAPRGPFATTLTP